MGYAHKMIDISYQTYGKYTNCTMNESDGLFYADSDFMLGGGLKPGSLPSPHQDTASKTEKARAMHKKAADMVVVEALRGPSLWKRIKRKFWG